MIMTPRINDILMKPVYINCPNSRYHGMLGTVTSCWFDESLGFEILYSIQLHRLMTDRRTQEETVVTGSVDMAIDEFLIAHPDFGVEL